MSSMDDLTARITAALDRAERRARAAMWANASDAATWTFQPATASYERPIVADGLGDGVVVVQPESADVEGVGEHVAHWDPKAVLELISAHREILAEHQPIIFNDETVCTRCWDDDGKRGLDVMPWPCKTALALAKAHRIEVPE